MANLYIYSDKKKPYTQFEFTSVGMERLNQKKAKMAKDWFKRLQREGLIPKRARFNGKIIGYQLEYEEGPPPSTPTYKKALLSILQGLNGDQDRDGLTDFNLESLVGKLEKEGLIPKAWSNQERVREALLSRRSARKLKYYPPGFTPYCDNRRVPSATTKAEDIRHRFEGNPYLMKDVIKYFRKYERTHSIEELRQELETYLKAYYVHVDKTSLKGSNVTERLGIGKDSDLSKYFTICGERAAIDCNIFAEISNVILRNLKIKGLSTRFVSVEYFGQDLGHTVLVAKIKGVTRWLINNDSIREYSEGLNDLAQTLSRDKEHLVSWICKGRTLGRSCRSPKKIDPKRVLIRSPYSNIRANAAKNLTNNPEPTALNAIRQALSDKDSLVQIAALSAFFKTSQLLHKDNKISKKAHQKNLQLILIKLAKRKRYKMELLENVIERYKMDLLEDVVEELVDLGKSGFEVLNQCFDNAKKYPPQFQRNVVAGLVAAYVIKHTASLRREDPEVIPLLKKALEGEIYLGISIEKASKPIYLLRLFVAKGNGEATRILVEAFNHPNEKMRHYILYTFAALEGNYSLDLGEQDKLLKFAMNYADARRHCFNTVNILGDLTRKGNCEALTALLGLLGNQLCAYYTLKELDSLDGNYEMDPPTQDALVETLLRKFIFSRHNWPYHEHSINILGDLFAKGNNKAMEALLGLVTGSQYTSAALKTLASLEGNYTMLPTHQEKLITALTSIFANDKVILKEVHVPGEGYRGVYHRDNDYAIKILGDLAGNGNKEAQNTLVKSLAHSHYRVRLAATQQLARLDIDLSTQDKVVISLKKLLDDVFHRMAGFEKKKMVRSFGTLAQKGNKEAARILLIMLYNTRRDVTLDDIFEEVEKLAEMGLINTPSLKSLACNTLHRLVRDSLRSFESVGSGVFIGGGPYITRSIKTLGNIGGKEAYNHLLEIGKEIERCRRRTSHRVEHVLHEYKALLEKTLAAISVPIP